MTDVGAATPRPRLNLCMSCEEEVTPGIRTLGANFDSSGNSGHLHEECALSGLLHDAAWLAQHASQRIDQGRFDEVEAMSQAAQALAGVAQATVAFLQWRDSPRHRIQTTPRRSPTDHDRP